MNEIKKSSKLEIFGWAMFDFANSSYTTVIITVIYCVMFTEIIVGDGPAFKMGNLLWSVCLSISYFIVLLSAPVIGAIADFSASKKKFLFFSYILTVSTTMLLYFVEPGFIALGMVLVILSNVGFALSESFVSSFLPSLGPPEDLGKISGYAWSLGYFGGLSSTLIVSFSLGSLIKENFSNLKFVGPITGTFFLIAAIPTFIWVKEQGQAKPLPAGENHFTTGFKRLRQTIRTAKEFKDLIILLLSFFFAYAGLSIVIAFAFIYGNQIIKWDDATRNLMFVLTQMTAAAGAFVFGFIQDSYGAKRTFIVTLVLWCVCVSLFFGANELTVFLNGILGTEWKSQNVFLVIGGMAGLGLGSTQSACRAMVGYFSPESKSGEFFGLWNMAGKLSAIVGLISLGFFQSFFGLQKAILLCAGFFFISIFIIIFVDEKRGRASAVSHEGL